MNRGWAAKAMRWGVAALLAVWAAAAWAATPPYDTQCSATPQKARLNELKTQGGGSSPRFIEVIILGSNVSVLGWEVGYADKSSTDYFQMGHGNGSVYDANGVYLGADSAGSAGTTFSYPTFIVYAINPMNAQWGEILLRDTAANQQTPPVPGVMDYLAYTTDASCTAHQWKVPVGGCVSASCVPWGASNTDISRSVDGTGGWAADPPNYPTTGSSNAGPGAPPGQQMLRSFTFLPNSGSFCSLTPTSVTLQARDTSGAIKTNYTGTAIVASTSAVAAGAGSYTFTPADQGQKTITLIDSLTESFILTAADSLIPGSAAASGSYTFSPANCLGGAFNAYETSTPAGAVSGVIKTRVAGTTIGLDLIALNAARTAINPLFIGAVKVELLGNLNLGVPLDANNCPTSATVLQTSTQTITLGRSSVALPAVSEAWRDVRVRISYPAVGTVIAANCANDNFAIRPASLSVASISDSNWGAAGASRTLYNTGAAGGNVHKAGQSFTISVTARNSLGATTGNYAGNPTVKTLACTLPAGCVNGTLSTGSWTGAGTRATSTASYSEVGSFNLTLEDQTFAVVDLNDDTAAELTIPQSPAPVSVGRFVPDHFAVNPNNTPQFKTFNDVTCAGRSFTYIGQPFGYATLPQALITAQNAANGTTANYQGTLWKLTAADVAESYASTPALDTSLVGAPTLSSNNDGTGLATASSADKLAFARSLTTPSAPFNAAIGLTVSVSDGSEAAVTGNGTIVSVSNPATTFNGSGSGIAFDAGNEFRYGRLWIANGHGSELLALPMTMETQHWNGIGFVTNTADNCTVIASDNLQLSNPQKNLALNETGITISGRFAAGKSNLTLNKPSGGDGLYNGSVEVCADLDVVTGSGDTSCQAATPANLPYLQGRWAGGAQYDKDPKARASFGLYRRGNEFIYFRENY